MSNSCDQTSILSNTSEIVENKRLIKLSPLRWSKSTSTFVLIPYSVVVSEIY